MVPEKLLWLDVLLSIKRNEILIYICAIIYTTSLNSFKHQECANLLSGDALCTLQL